jgi:1,4-dihydroxy-2-naphthoate octaprenyltransferase
VFVFFGPVAAVGTAFIQVGQLSWNALIGGAAAGFWASAVLMVNNIRDREQDAKAGKRTLSVKLGARGSKIAYALLVLLPFPLLVPFVLLYPATWATWLTLLFALPLVMIVSTAKSVPEYLLALKLTSYGALAYGVLLGFGLYRISNLF